MKRKAQNPFAKLPPAELPPPCQHGRRRGPFSICTICDEEDQRAFSTRPPNEMRLVETSTGRTVATYRIPKGQGPTTKGRRMGKRPTLSPSYGNADARPRLHLRLAEQDGQVAIGYRSHPTGLEHFAPTIELAMAELLGDEIGKPAVLVWDGITSGAVRIREQEDD